MLPIPHLGTLAGALEDKAALLQKAMHDLAVSIALADRTGQTQAAAMLRQQLAQRSAEYANVVAQIKAKEGGSTIASRIGDVQTTTSNLFGSVSQGVQALGKNLPLLAIAAIGIVALIGLRRSPVTR
jgi:hypothetical protein